MQQTTHNIVRDVWVVVSGRLVQFWARLSCVANHWAKLLLGTQKIHCIRHHKMQVRLQNQTTNGLQHRRVRNQRGTGTGTDVCMSLVTLVVQHIVFVDDDQVGEQLESLRVSYTSRSRFLCLCSNDRYPDIEMLFKAIALITSFITTFASRNAACLSSAPGDRVTRRPAQLIKAHKNFTGASHALKSVWSQTPYYHRTQKHT
jgi:hypothetical protein